MSSAGKIQFQVRYPINQRSPRGMTNRFRVGSGPGMINQFNQKPTQRFANKPKKPKQKVKKEGEEIAEDVEKKSIFKDEETKENW